MCFQLQVVTWGDTSSGADSRRVKEQLENCRDLSCPGLSHVKQCPVFFFCVFFSGFWECLTESIRVNIKINFEFSGHFERL